MGRENEGGGDGRTVEARDGRWRLPKGAPERSEREAAPLFLPCSVHAITMGRNRRLVLVLEVLLVPLSAAFTPPACCSLAVLGGHRPRTAAIRATEFSEEEDDGGFDDEATHDRDLDVAWQRVRLEGIADGWWQEARLSALENLPKIPDRRVAWRENIATLIGMAAFLAMLQVWVLHSGGLILACDPDGHVFPLRLLSFSDLHKMEPEKLLKLGLPLPAAAPPPQLGNPAKQAVLRLLLGADGDVVPTA